MATKKRSKKTTRLPAKTSSLQPIQIGALLIVVAAVAAIIWAIIASRKPAQGLTESTVQTPASTMQAYSSTEQAPFSTEQAPAPTEQAPSSAGPKQFSSAPPMTIDKNKQYTATFKMAKGGEFVIQLYPDKSPITVNSFVFLARQKFFDGVTFHRVLPGFMAQGGDPTGTGMGGPGYQFVNEDSDLKFDKPGVVAMANAGRDTNGSQFFITFVPTPQLDGDYTIFGQVISGMDVVNGITLRDPQQNPTFPGDTIQSITITEK